MHRATNEDGPYSRIRTTTEASYLDTSAAEGIRYHYRVDAVDAAGNESAPSTAVPGVRGDLIPPSPLTGLTVTRPSTASP
ncbi:hypothetical protein [Streptomyces sp. NPDC020951]|uniref:hypothetical protein n=1 Tax=Streptomyces sp. NPDC020951 TaxID=3365104 RepID=UPI0037A7816B